MCHTSPKTISIRAEWLRQGGRAPLAQSKTPWRRITLRPASIPPAGLHIALRSTFCCLFSLCWSPISKKTLWGCDQLWPYVGMGSLGTHLHQDCNAMGDAAEISPSVPSTLSSRSVGGRWEDMILPGREDWPNCVDPRNLRQSEWNPKLGKIECEFSMYDKRGWKWDNAYLLRGLPNIYSPLLCPPWLPLYLRTTAVGRSRCIRSSVFQMHLESEIEWTEGCTWMPWLSEFGYALGDWDWVNSEMHLEARIEGV